MQWLLWIEQTPLSVLIRESPSLLAFPSILYLHTLGLAMLAGISVGLDIWLLTVATRVPRISIAGLYRVMWLGFGINAISGALLLAAYPAKALTNVVFYIKMLLVVLAVWVVQAMRDEVFEGATPGEPLAITARGKALAVGSLVLWTGTIFTGRLLAYTHSILMASDPW